MNYLVEITREMYGTTGFRTIQANSFESFRNMLMSEELQLTEPQCKFEFKYKNKTYKKYETLMKTVHKERFLL